MAYEYYQAVYNVIRPKSDADWKVIIYLKLFLYKFNKLYCVCLNTEYQGTKLSELTMVCPTSIPYGL